MEAAESARRAEEELTGSAGAFDRYRVGAQLARGLSQADVDDFEELSYLEVAALHTLDRETS
jgi:hypothetical protein